MSAAPRTIAFLLPHFRAGGAERVVLNWIGELDRARFRPLLLLGRAEGAFLDLLPRDVVPRALGANRALLSARPIARALAEHDVAIAYSATNAMNLALLAAPIRSPTARIVSEHTPPAAYLAEARLPSLRRAAMRRFYPRADTIAVPTDAIGAALRGIVGTPLTIATIPNPVISVADIRAVPVAPQPPIPRLVAAGRLVAAKGFDTLVAACAMLAEQGVAFRLDIFGEGPLRGTLASQIAAAGLAAIVRLAGHSDRLGDAIADADLFVLSSRREGFGNVVIEAMAAGVPVLATRGGGPEAVICDGETGFLVPPDDPAALAAAIRGLLDDPTRRRAVRAPAQRLAAQYDIASSTRQFESLLDTLAKPDRRHA